MNITNITATLNFNLKYGDFAINISNTHERKISFSLSEFNGREWVKIPRTAADYILKDFKQTEEYKKIQLIYGTILPDYGF